MGKKNYGSCYGAPYQRYRYLLKYMEDYYGRKIKILIPNALDGQHVLPSIRKGYLVDCYESKKEFISGGIIGSYNIIGLEEKISYFEMNDSVSLFKNNFYEQRIEREYEFVYCYKSLHLQENKNIPKDTKMRKLLSSVKENGFIYLYYHLALNENDYINYPKEQYFRRDEMKKYFDDSKGTYGYRRIVDGLLQKYGVIMNGKKVLRIMKKYNLMAEYIRKARKKHKNERIEDNVKPDLLNRNFTTDKPNKV